LHLLYLVFASARSTQCSLRNLDLCNPVATGKSSQQGELRQGILSSTFLPNSESHQISKTATFVIRKTILLLTILCTTEVSYFLACAPAVLRADRISNIGFLVNKDEMFAEPS
jgi:hypothetical protein